MLPLNIRVDKNCQPTWVTQNAIPREQELISLGGGHYDPPPDKVGLNGITKLVNPPKNIFGLAQLQLLCYF